MIKCIERKESVNHQSVSILRLERVVNATKWRYRIMRYETVVGGDGCLDYTEGFFKKYSDAKAYFDTLTEDYYV